MSIITIKYIAFYRILLNTMTAIQPISYMIRGRGGVFNVEHCCHGCSDIFGHAAYNYIYLRVLTNSLMSGSS